MTRRNTLIAVIAVAVFAVAMLFFFGRASAADMPIQPPPRGVHASAFNWTGIYGGVHVGYGWADTSHATPTLPAPFPALSLSSSPSGDDWLYGVEAAALYQFPSTIIVAGIAADYSWGQLSGSSIINLNGPAGCGPCGPLAGTSYSVSLEDIGTVKGVLGLSMGRVLPYVTGGVAFAEGRATASAPGGSISASDDLWGWTVGGGVMLAMTDRIMLGLDYSYLRFDDGNYAFNAFGPIAVTAGGKTDAHVVKAKALLKF